MQVAFLAGAEKEFLKSFLVDRKMIKDTTCIILMAAVISTVILSCVPVHPSAQNLVGGWQVVWSCGTERLELRDDATFTQSIDYAGGGKATHRGTWTIEPSKSRFEGAHVVLKNSMLFCSEVGDRLSRPFQADRRLETIWEWGRVILSFNPDMQGFTRQ